MQCKMAFLKTALSCWFYFYSFIVKSGIYPVCVLVPCSLTMSCPWVYLLCYLITTLFCKLSRSCKAGFGPSKILVLCTFPPIKTMLSSLDEASSREKHLGKIMRTSGFVYFRNSSGSKFHFPVFLFNFSYVLLILREHGLVSWQEKWGRL